MCTLSELSLITITMKYVTTYLKPTVGILALGMAFAMSTSASALDSGVYLDASASQASPVVDLDTSVELKADASAKDTDGTGQYKTQMTATSSSQEKNGDFSASSSWNKFWSFFKISASSTSSGEEHGNTGLWASLVSFFTGTTTDSVNGSASTTQSSPVTFTSSVVLEEVSNTQATISWSPAMSSSVRVYYATTSPVLTESTTQHVSVSPWKFWHRGSVTLKGLTPNTTYFYKVVADTDSGTTTTTEAIFRTTVN